MICRQRNDPPTRNRLSNPRPSNSTFCGHACGYALGNAFQWSLASARKILPYTWPAMKLAWTMILKLHESSAVDQDAMALFQLTVDPSP